jgi:putative flippase GtrA
LDAEPAHRATLHDATADRTSSQLLRFGMVGLLVNLGLYAAYLGMVGLHVAVKVAMSCTYACGVVLSFVLNRRWSFASTGPLGGEAWRYLVVYLAGYLLNLSALALFVDALGLAHQAVQGAMMFIIAALVFGLQKYWVFRRAGQPAVRS